LPKTVVSFYCDDTNPYVAPPSAFATFLDFVRDEGIAGESTVLLGYEASSKGLLSRPGSDVERSYINQLKRAYSCGIDTHMELMTHGGLFDFAENRIPVDAIHEGVWLFEPGVSVDEYESYFSHIIGEGERIGIRFTGLTQPGCGCAACVSRHRQLSEQGATETNPNMHRALLNLAKRGRFRGKTVPMFIGSGGDVCAARAVAAEGGCAVYDLPPNATDWLGLWLNAADKVDPDYYISEDGQVGRIVDSVRAKAQYCIFYAHWQGLNPANGVGWNAFKTVVHRIGKHLSNEVIWQRPSAYTDGLCVGRTA